jgi:putative oxidoreductase
MSDVMDRVFAASHDLTLLVARAALASIYLASGFQKLTHLAEFAQSLSRHGLPDAGPLAVLGASVEFVGALCILLGVKIRWAALVMAVFTVVATLISHRFWAVADAAQHANQQIHFMKNVAITGGFLALFAAGPGRHSLDHRIGERLTPARTWR